MHTKLVATPKKHAVKQPVSFALTPSAPEAAAREEFLWVVCDPLCKEVGQTLEMDDDDDGKAAYAFKVFGKRLW